MKIKIYFPFLLIFILSYTSCGDGYIPTPKPHAYPKIDFPEREYQKYKHPNCGFQFEYPMYSNIVKDSLFFGEKSPSDCWFNINLPIFNGKIHFSQENFNKTLQLEKLISDAFLLTNKHNIKADYIDEFLIHKKKENVFGVVFDIQGPAASPFQFYLTDSTSNFVRGALYFESKVNPDSIAPIYEFVKKDIMNLINTFEW